MKVWDKVTLSQLSQVGHDLRELIEKPALILLTGEVGAGKTTFVKAFAGEYAISSPTYSLISEYNDLVHADFYRLKDPKELQHLELELYFDDKDYFFVEWGKEYSDNLKTLLGDTFSYYEMVFEIQGDSKERKIRLF